MRLRSSIYWVTLIALLLAANLSAQAGTVGLGVSVQGTGGNCPQGNVVCRGCTVKIVATASDCDEWDSQCCWDDLEFPVWELGSPPTRQADGSYRSESIVTCDWIGPRTFNFSANDLVHCTNQEDDLPATQTVTITCIEVVDMTGPTEPICPGTNVEFQVTTSPDNLGVGLLTWTGGEDGEVSPYDLHIYHADFSAPGTYDVSAKCGEQGITRQVVVDEPVYEVTCLEPVGVVGGLARVMVQVKTRCAGLVGNGVLIQRENPDGPYCQDGWCPLEGGHPTWEESSGPDQEGIYTSIFKTYWDTLSLKNGTYHLRAKGSFSVAPDWQQEVPFEVPLSVNVKNLSFTSADPEGVIAWKGEENETESLTVHLEDNDLSDPMTLTLKLYPTNMDNSNRQYPECTDAITLTGVTGESQTFVWDGNEGMAEPGLYTHSIEASQVDICNTDPNLQILDEHVRYRSEHTNIWRPVDGEGMPIYEAEYDGYDDNGTPDDDTDDNYLYIVRHYVLTDSDGWNASEGRIWLYGPGLTRLCEWGIGSLPCLEHGDATDGLSPGYHRLRVPVLTSLMDDEGMYRFVAHIKDDHGVHYRNGEDRWALDLNGTICTRQFHIEDDWMVTPSPQRALKAAARSGRLKDAFAAASWIVRTAGHPFVRNEYCTAVPYRETLPSHGERCDFSGDYFHYSDRRNGGWFATWPYRYVHVIGAAYLTKGDPAPKYGLSSGDFLGTNPRWCYVFAQEMEDMDPVTPVSLDDLVKVTTHEVGHQLGCLDHPEGTWDSYKTKRDLYCVMTYDWDCDFAFCETCLQAMRNYHGCGW